MRDEIGHNLLAALAADIRAAHAAIESAALARARRALEAGRALKEANQCWRTAAGRVRRAAGDGGRSIDLSKRDVGLIILSMDGERLDTRNPTSKLILTILAGVATWEREIMLERQRVSVAKAKAEGKYKGRPAHIDAAEIKRLSADLGPAAIAKQLGVAQSTVYRLLG